MVITVCPWVVGVDVKQLSLILLWPVYNISLLVYLYQALDTQGNALHVNQVTGALTTIRNPTFKIYYVDVDTLRPTHYDTYFINISKTEGIALLQYLSFVQLVRLRGTRIGLMKGLNSEIFVSLFQILYYNLWHVLAKIWDLFGIIFLFFIPHSMIFALIWYWVG